MTGESIDKKVELALANKKEWAGFFKKAFQLGVSASVAAFTIGELTLPCIKRVVENLDYNAPGMHSSEDAVLYAYAAFGSLLPVCVLTSCAYKGARQFYNQFFSEATAENKKE